MRRLPRYLLLAFTMLLSCGVPSLEAQEAAVPAAPTTIWNRLGFPEGMRKLRGNLTNRRGNNPQREPKVPLKALNNPANLAEDMPPIIKKAAEVKIQEDMAPQKIKAIKYLTQIGCACYDKTGEITAALILASEDCTEEVRLVTMQSILAAAHGKCCANCGMKCCCKPDLTMQLSKIAYDRDATGCYIEPSKRVRDAALEALCACCPNAEPVTEAEPEPLPAKDKEEEGEKVEQGADEEGDAEEVEGDNEESAEDMMDDESEVPAPMDEDRTTDEESGDKPEVEEKSLETALPIPREARAVPKRGTPSVLTSASNARTTDTPATVHGVVVQVDAKLRIAHVHFFDVQDAVPNGTQLMAVSERDGERYWVGPFQVYQPFADSANVTAASSVDFGQLTVGTQVVATLELNASATTRQVARELAPVVPAHRPIAPW